MSLNISHLVSQPLRHLLDKLSSTAAVASLLMKWKCFKFCSCRDACTIPWLKLLFGLKSLNKIKTLLISCFKYAKLVATMQNIFAFKDKKEYLLHVWSIIYCHVLNSSEIFLHKKYDQANQMTVSVSSISVATWFIDSLSCSWHWQTWKQVTAFNSETSMNLLHCDTIETDCEHKTAKLQWFKMQILETLIHECRAKYKIFLDAKSWPSDWLQITKF